MKLRVKKYIPIPGNRRLKFYENLRYAVEEYLVSEICILGYIAAHARDTFNLYFNKIISINYAQTTESFEITVSDLCKKFYNYVISKVDAEKCKQLPSRPMDFFGLDINSKLYYVHFTNLYEQFQFVLPYILNKILSQMLESAKVEGHEESFYNVCQNKFPAKPNKIICLMQNKTTEPIIIAATFSNFIYTIMPELFQFLRTIIRMIVTNGFSTKLNKTDEQNIVDETTIKALSIVFNLRKEDQAKISTEITVGLDPEFEVYSTMKSGRIDFKNGFKPANNYLHGNDTDVGVDGCSRIAEIRPTADTDPTKVALNTRDLVSKMYHQLQAHSTSLTALSGGGFHNSTGGHIHFGNKIFRSLGWDNQLEVLGKLLDHFLYLPIRENMPGAIRVWNVEDPEITPIVGKYDWRNDEIHKAVIAAKPKKDVREVGYDIRSQFRTKEYGIEYRSLPSFLCDFTFTRLVLKIAKGLAEKFLDAVVSSGELEVNLPPKDEDYLQVLTPKELRVFKTYLSGDRRTRLVEPIFKNWPITFKKTEQQATTQASGRMRTFDEIFTQEQSHLGDNNSANGGR